LKPGEIKNVIAASAFDRTFVFRFGIVHFFLQRRGFDVQGSLSEHIESIYNHTVLEVKKKLLFMLTFFMVGTQ
jgi:hypothetical protein